jgi:hypothetical protein
MLLSPTGKAGVPYGFGGYEGNDLSQRSDDEMRIHTSWQVALRLRPGRLINWTVGDEG